MFPNIYCQSCDIFSNLHFPKNACTSTQLVAVHTHRSHTFTGTFHYGEEAWGEHWLSLTQLCRRFTTRVTVSRLTIKFHCEIYLKPFLECVLQGLVTVRLMVMSPSAMKFHPDDNPIFSIFNQWHSLKDMTYSVYTRPCNSQNLWVDQEDVSPEVPFTLMTVLIKLSTNPPLLALGSVITEPTL